MWTPRGLCVGARTKCFGVLSYILNCHEFTLCPITVLIIPNDRRHPSTEDIHQLQQDTPAHNELRAPMNQFMECQFANQEPLRNNLLIPTLESRIIQAAKLRGALAQMVHAISRNFTIRNTNQIMEQLIIRCQGDLNVYIRNEMLMHNHCMEIVGSLGLKMLDTMLSVDD